MKIFHHRRHHFNSPNFQRMRNIEITWSTTVTRRIKPSIPFQKSRYIPHVRVLLILYKPQNITKSLTQHASFISSRNKVTGTAEKHLRFNRTRNRNLSACHPIQQVVQSLGLRLQAAQILFKNISQKVRPNPSFSRRSPRWAPYES